MMLIEETTVPDAALPVEQFKAHLRLGTGFGEDSLQDGVLNGFLRAAVAAIEARTGKILIQREFIWSAPGWRDPTGQDLPVAPVVGITEVAIRDVLDIETVLAPSSYRLETDSQRPKLRPIGTVLPRVATGGTAQVRFTAGYAVDWGGLPADLGQAVLLLAAHYYEYRSETGLSDGCMPFGVSSLIQRYRVMRVGLGAGQ